MIQDGILLWIALFSRGSLQSLLSTAVWGNAFCAALGSVDGEDPDHVIVALNQAIIQGVMPHCPVFVDKF